MSTPSPTQLTIYIRADNEDHALYLVGKGQLDQAVRNRLDRFLLAGILTSAVPLTLFRGILSAREL